MRFTKTFISSIKGTTKDYDSLNHAMLVQAGFIDQVASGIYTILPPGQRVLRKIENIIRQEMNAIGSEEITIPALHPKPLWEQTRRWNSVNVLFKLKSRHSQEYALAASAEEVMFPLAAKYIESYKDLPLSLYQISSKFRDEERAKSGILRGREFRMKDMYSFHADHDDFLEYYEKVTAAYLKAFARMGLTDVKITEASGGDFSKKRSHEFNVLTPAGEVDLVYCADCEFAQNRDIIKREITQCPKCNGINIKEDKAIEIANIFDLGTDFSKLCNVKYINSEGDRQLVVGGCFGIGTTRLIGAIAEVHHDEFGMIWPQNIAPFHAHLVNLHKDDSAFSDVVYRTLQSEGFDVLYDDRSEISAGEKFVIADLVGAPVRLVVSPNTGASVEYKLRNNKNVRLYSPAEVVKALKDLYLS